MPEPDTHDAGRTRQAEAERHQRILSEVSRVLLDYVGPDEVEPLRRIVDKVTQSIGDWCAFALVQPDGTMRNVAAYHPDPRQRELEQKLNALVLPAKWDAGPPQYNALVLREPLVIEEITDDMLRVSQPSEEVYQLYKEVGMTSVLVNLLANAIKYSPGGGQIVVRVEVQGAEARVSVTDPGIGIPPEEQGKLFQRFFRAANATTRNYAGLGIGLFVSHEIVERHHGRFEVSSELGAGSTFTFFLPLAPGETAARTRARVLLVDDDPEILEATGQVLREWGYAVDEARDGATALALARGARPDLMLVDLMMPVMDGWTLIQRLREARVAPGVPLVVFSADRDGRDKAKKLDADAALRTPFELQELQDVVERLLPQKPAV